MTTHAAPDVTTPRNHFSLNKIADVSAQYAPPEAAFDPEGAYDHAYAICTILQDRLFAPEGELRIRRTPADDGARLALLAARRGSSEHSQYIDAVIDCRADALSSPVRFEAAWKMAEAPDAPAYLNSGMQKTGRIDGDELLLETQGAARRHPLGGAFTCKWNLLDAVQRLPGPDFPGAEFTLIDEFDQTHPGQRLAFRTRARVAMAGGPRTLTAYEHLGPAVLPTVYWVDELGRTLFAISGSEAYVLKEADGTAIEYRVPNIVRKPEWSDAS